MAKAPPQFNFYYNDWLGGVQDLTAEEERHYLRLLIHQWQNGHLPARTVKRMNICGVTDLGRWQQIWDSLSVKFEPVEMDGETVLVNMRMHEDREEALSKWKARVERNRENGKKGGRPRKSSPDNPNSHPPQNPVGFSKKPTSDKEGDIDLSFKKEGDARGRKKPSLLETWEQIMEEDRRAKGES